VMILARGLTADTTDTALTPQSKETLRPSGRVKELPGGVSETGPLDPVAYLGTLRESEVVVWREDKATGRFNPVTKPGADLLRPGTPPQFTGTAADTVANRLNFVSLMLALFCGTASLPHILIRYYTVKDVAAARKSTVVGIATIAAFYLFALFLGLGAMTGGNLDVSKSNTAAPRLAQTFGEVPFALISAVAFTTVLGTVAGLIVAASGAVVHDLLGGWFKLTMTDAAKVRAGKLTAVGVGAVAVALGILFEKLNVTYLVGWAFSIAASANLPALVMLLFWKGTTKQGIIASVLVGMVTSLGWVLLSGDAFKSVYGLKAEDSPVPFSQPGIVTIPLSFAVLVVVSLFTRPKAPPN
jgi:cation/acetate symporter